MAIDSTLGERGFTIGCTVLKISFYARFSLQEQLFVTRKKAF
jgi:hypothetical protein